MNENDDLWKFVVKVSPVMGRVVPNKPYVPDHIHGGA